MLQQLMLPSFPKKSCMKNVQFIKMQFFAGEINRLDSVFKCSLLILFQKKIRLKFQHNLTLFSSFDNNVVNVASVVVDKGMKS